MHSLFEKDDNEKYKKSALMYQDLLRCLSYQANCYIKLFDIIDWMLDKNKELSDFYSAEDKKHTPLKVKRANRRNTIKYYLDNLVSLNLLKSQNIKEERGDGNTTAYKLKDWGALTSHIIDLDEKNDNDEILKEIFMILQKSFAKLTSSREAFFSIFLNKCIEKNYFKSYVLYLKDLLSDSAVTDKNVFLKYFMFVPLDNEEETKRLWELWKESYFELTSERQKLFIQSLKVQLEYFIDQRINAYNTFEILRFDNSYTYVDDLVIELKCNNCDKYYPSIINIIAYFEMVINEDYKNIDNKSCIVCNKGKLVLTPELKNFNY